ncbi:MAG: L-ribulose-5-phosphate 4-epimerase [Ignavibacteriales bacterium]|nr:MAG: L-ribulose-5-phosphate 4-epimerase [Ignavibacteriales bacterium]
MTLRKLKEEVLKANLELAKSGLVIFSWGNVSGINRAEGLIAIKPSGIEYDVLKIEDMVVVDFNENIVEGNKRPSSDTATHIELYKNFPGISGITHTHSIYATAFAQACKDIPCLGTTHADAFNGAIPVTRFLSKEEVEIDYEKNTGKIIVERFKNLDPNAIPAVLVAGHAPFSWGQSAADSVKNSIILEQIALMAVNSLQINSKVKNLPEYILQKHFSRKHGPNAYYGQKRK